MNVTRVRGVTVMFWGEPPLEVMVMVVPPPVGGGVGEVGVPPPPPPHPATANIAVSSTVPTQTNFCFMRSLARFHSCLSEELPRDVESDIPVVVGGPAARHLAHRRAEAV